MFAHMSQKEVLKILKDIGGEATSSEIREQARQEFPNRQLFNYASMRLNSLKKRGLVSKNKDNDDVVWSITNQGEKTSLKKYTIEVSCDDADKQRLIDEGIDIVNIVCVVYNQDEIRFNLPEISQDMTNSVYNPEDDGFLTFYPSECENAAIRVPTSGTINIAGAKSKDEVYRGVSCFENNMNKLEYDVDISPNDIEVQNIVGQSNIQREIDLRKLASDMPECVEYNNSNSPTLIFRPDTQGTIMMYRTGKIITVGVKTYYQVVKLYQNLNRLMPEVEDAKLSFG